MSEVRAIALYRASTKQQTDKANQDIPTQRKIVRDFIFQQNWGLVREFTEGGISGFKKSANDRDALQTIKRLAVAKEFDILVVYMSDRIGRIADETPLVIKFLNEQGVKVISVSEGEIKSDTHADKLITFIRYWQNEGESLKTSKRVTDYHIAAIEEGRFRGGSYIPYGYKLVDNGNKNFKGRNILDFLINEEEAKIVILIYNLSMNYNYGQSRIAKYLNEHGHKTRNGNVWHSSSIQYILANPMYKGQFHMHSELYDKEIISPTRKDLIIIPEVDWERNRLIVKNRKYSKTHETIKDERHKTHNNNHGAMLLSGLAFCGNCGQALTTMTAYKRWTTADGTKKRVGFHKYRCGSFYKKGTTKCDGQSTYSINRIEPYIIDMTKNFVYQLEQKQLNQDYIKKINKQIEDAKQLKQKLSSDLKKLFEQSKKLSEKIGETLLDEEIEKNKDDIIFTPKQLKQAINITEEKIENISKDLKNIELKIHQLNIDKQKYVNFDIDIKDWAYKFDKASFENKKAMLNKIIDKITITKQENGNLKIKVDWGIEALVHNGWEGCNNTKIIRVLA